MFHLAGFDLCPCSNAKRFGSDPTRGRMTGSVGFTLPGVTKYLERSLAAFYPFWVGRCCLPLVQFHSPQEMDCVERKTIAPKLQKLTAVERALAASQAVEPVFPFSVHLPSLSACWYLKLLWFLFFFSFCEWMLEMCTTAAVGVIAVFHSRYANSKAGTASCEGKRMATGRAIKNNGSTYERATFSYASPSSWERQPQRQISVASLPVAQNQSNLK